jgi:hypothetical protein
MSVVSAFRGLTHDIVTVRDRAGAGGAGLAALLAQREREQ